MQHWGVGGQGSWGDATWGQDASWGGYGNDDWWGQPWQEADETLKEPLEGWSGSTSSDAKGAGWAAMADASVPSFRPSLPQSSVITGRPKGEVIPAAKAAFMAAPGEAAKAESARSPNEDYDNFVKFVTTTMQAARRTILKSGRPWMGLKELPGNFERTFGTVFEKSRLGLQDHSDLADLLSLWPECFIVDRLSPTGPTVSVKPGNTKVLPLSESISRMLFKRSRELQPKKSAESHRDLREEVGREKRFHP